MVRTTATTRDSTRAGSDKPPARERGLTAVEIIVALAILGILVGVGAARMSPSPARLAANTVQATVQQAKFESIRRNRPLVVILDPSTNEVHVRYSQAAGSIECNEAVTTEVRSTDLSEYRGVRLTANAERFVWLPNGQVRGCAGEWLAAEVVVQLDDGARSSTVVVSTGGEVTVQ